MLAKRARVAFGIPRTFATQFTTAAVAACTLIDFIIRLPHKSAATVAAALDGGDMLSIDDTRDKRATMSMLAARFGCQARTRRSGDKIRACKRWRVSRTRIAAAAPGVARECGKLTPHEAGGGAATRRAREIICSSWFDGSGLHFVVQNRHLASIQMA